MSALVDGLQPALSGRYEVLRELGRGGMATVYLARDLKHPRSVAVKVLRADVARTLGAERFLHEIELAAQLQHPHILGLIDSGTGNGVLYYAMPYVEGESLRQRLDRETQLQVDDAVGIAREVADALHYAHGRGIVHRDIKPENILISGGHAMVADFGIAKALSAAGGDRLTETGLSLGTPHYMSPEQATATQSLDGRSDIYALGCVLYEMLAGSPPFTGPTAQAIMARHSVDPVPNLHTVRGTVPAGVEWAISKALAKVPADRFSTAGEFSGILAHPERAPVQRTRRPRVLRTGLLVAILALAAGLGGRGISDWAAGRVSRVRSLAILPVENLTGDSTQLYLADGMTDQFITDLAQIQALRVIGRTSVMRYAGTRKNAQQIAGELHVDALLATSLQRAGDSIHLSAQLTSGTNGQALWAQSYDGPVRDVRRLQSDVARALAARIHIALTPDERARLGAPVRTIDPGSFAAYLKGRYFLNKGDFKAAKRFFTQALDIDPTDAAAYAGLAETYNQVGYGGALPPDEAFPLAKAHAARAIEADSTNAEGHAALAYATMYYDWDWTKAEREYRTAIALSPSSAIAHNWYSLFLLAMGRFDEAEVEGRRAMQLDPLSVAIAREYGWIAHYSGRQDSAVARVKRALAMNEADKVTHLYLGRAYQAQGRYAEAMKEYEATGPLQHWAVTVAAAGYVAAKQGDRQGVSKAFAELDSLAKTPQNYVAPLLKALMYTALGDKDRAFADLDQSVKERVHWLLWLNRDPRWIPLRSDPRFGQLRHRIGLPE